MILFNRNPFQNYFRAGRNYFEMSTNFQSFEVHFTINWVLNLAKKTFFHFTKKVGHGSEAVSKNLMRADPRLTSKSDTFFPGYLVMKKFQRRLND